MNIDDTLAIRAIVQALYVKRNRFGRLEGDAASRRPMAQLEALRKKLPHGGADTVDQAMMLLQIMVGDEPTSINDAIEQPDGTLRPRKRKPL